MVGAVLLASGSLMMAQGKASQADRDFVAEVSQGGAYEVEAGKVAALRGISPVVKNFGVLESHDRAGVGAGLKRIAGMTGVSIAPGMNAEFSARLAKLKSVSPDQFDAYYVGDMKQIHNKDQGLFASEANEGTGPYKEFCH